MVMSLSTLRSLPARPATVNEMLGASVAVSCAMSAGVHGALVADHLHESALLGVAFGVDALLLALGAVVVNGGRGSSRRVASVAVLLAATAVAYLLSRTTGIAWLVPEVEPVDGLGAVITLIELLGVTACLLTLLRRERP
jgi:hypothetical protein